MSKRSRGDDDIVMEETLGPRTAKRKALSDMAVEKAKKDAVAQKREVSKKLRADVDYMAGLFGKMSAAESSMDGQGRRKRRTRKQKKSKKSKKTRKH